MDTNKTIAILTDDIDNLLLSKDYPGLGTAGTWREENGDLMVCFHPPGQEDLVVVRIQIQHTIEG